MALKDWSIGKIVGVMFGGFFVVLIITLIAVNVVKKQRATSTSSLVNVVPSEPMTAQPMNVPSRVGTASRSRNDGLLDDQLRQFSDKLDALQQQLDQQGQKTQQNNQAIMQNFSTIQGGVNALADRVSALEHPSVGPVEIVKPAEKPRVSETKRLARTAKSIPRRTGYQAEAVVSKRAWLRVNGVEATRSVGEDLPQASEPARIEAMSADSGIYVVPGKSH